MPVKGNRGNSHIVLAAACGVALAFGALGLSGCSGAHQMIAAGEDCSSCHSDSKASYDVASPKDAIASNGTVNVKTSASSVVVCVPTFISEDGSRFVPEQRRTVNVSGAQATIELEQGTWALVVADGDNVKASKIVVVDGSAAAADVEL